MNLAISILLIVIGAILLFACVINPRRLSGRGGGLFVDMQELFQAQSLGWRVVGLLLGVGLIAGGGVGSYVPSPGGQGQASSIPTSTAVMAPTPTFTPFPTSGFTSSPSPTLTQIPTAEPAPSPTPVRPTPLAVDSVVVATSQENVEVGKDLQLTAAVFDKEGNLLPGRAITWNSTSPEVADVDRVSGKVTGKSEGNTAIVATSEGITDVVVVTVVPVPVAEIMLSPESLTIVEGEEPVVTARLLDRDGSELTDRQVNWRSSNNEIAKVVSISPLEGLITSTDATPGVNPSFVTITGVAGETTSPPLPLWVNHGPVSSIQVGWQSPSPFVVAISPCFERRGDTGQLKATLRDQAGHTLISRSVSWQSNQPSIVSVDENGKVTRNGEGNATVSASVDVVVRGTIDITVPNPQCMIAIE